MSKTNKKTQNNQRKGGNQNSNSKKNKQNPRKQGNGQQRSGKQASVAAAYATRSEGKAPKIQASRDTCNIKHREFIGNVSGSILFQIALALSVNPGLSSTFPWLSIMAQAWEQYKFRKLKFVFLTRTGSNTPGSVIMSPDYDSSDAAPATEQIMSTYDGTVEDAPWKDNACNLKVNLLSGAGGPRKFVRTGALSPNQDVKLYDVANMFVGTVDGTAVAWGKLWVEYDIDFWVPQLPPTGLTPGVSTLSGTAGTAAAIVSAGQLISGNLISGQVGNVISLQNMLIGSEIVIYAEGTVVTAGVFTQSAPVGLTLKSTMLASATPVPGGFTYTVTASIGSITITAAGALTNPLVSVVQIPTLAF